MPDAAEFDPFRPEHRDAWDLLAGLRAHGPVATISGGMAYVTGHAGCRAALRDTDALSNAAGMKAPGVVIPYEDRILGELDPPGHTRIRRIMVTALSPKAVHGAEPFIRRTAIQLLDAFEVTGIVDLVASYTVALPNRVTVHLLGFPPDDADTIAAMAKSLMESEFPLRNATDRGEGFAGAFPEFAAYIDEQIDVRRAAIDRGAPRDDVVTRLLQMDVDGEPLTATQARALTRNLITGGLTTTSQLLGNLLYLVLRDPELDAQVRRDDATLDRAIEESLRLSPPVLFVARSCTRDTRIGGQDVTAGRRVVVGTASANRDEQVFAEPDVFDATRNNADQHLTFGFGPHVCPGATLARVVARIGVRAFLDRFAPGSVALEPGYALENVPTFFEIGPRRLPVIVR